MKNRSIFKPIIILIDYTSKSILNWIKNMPSNERDQFDYIMGNNFFMFLFILFCIYVFGMAQGWWFGPKAFVIFVETKDLY